MKGGMGNKLVFLTIVRFLGFCGVKRAGGRVINAGVNDDVNGVNARRGEGLKVF